MKQQNESFEFFLSEEELAQLQGGTTGIRNLNEAVVSCVCNNKPVTSLTNRNSGEKCECDCTSGTNVTPPVQFNYVVGINGCN